MSKEIWKPVRGFEKFYEVSSEGRVRSWKKPGTSKQLATKPRVLTGSGHPDGYKVFSLNNPGEPLRAFYVHRLVAEHFLGEIPAGMQVCHRNGDPTDNRASNLRIDTPEANAADKVKHGTLVQGEKHPRAKLSEIDVKQLKMILDADTLTVTEIAESLGVASGTIAGIRDGKTWKHVPCFA